MLDPDIVVACVYGYAQQDARTLTGGVEIFVKMKTRSISASHLIITDNAYGQPDITIPLPSYGDIDFVTQAINLEKSLGWYDFTVRIPGNEKYYRRYTGHVETGEAGYTDPYMGCWDSSVKPALV
jgi:phospholipase C